MNELQQKCVDRIHECFRLARERWPQLRTYLNPTIDFNTRGTTAGWAKYGQNRISLNNTLLQENGDEFVSRTPGHEAAHFIAYRALGHRGHGEPWKQVMRFLGQDPSRCHQFDTTNSRVKKRGGRTVPYVCLTCGGSLMMTQHAHVKHVSGLRYWHKCGAGKRGAFRGVKGKIEPKALVEGNGLQVAPRPAPTPIKVQPLPRFQMAADGGSKLDRARRIFDSSLTRQQMIAKLVAEVGLTPAGASTYYQKLKAAA